MRGENLDPQLFQKMCRDYRKEEIKKNKSGSLKRIRIGSF